MRHPHEIALDPASGAWLKTTLTLRRIDGVQVPFQNGIPVPSFDPQERIAIPLRGTWKKIRFTADHDFSMSPRNPAWLDRLEATEGAYLRGRSDDGWQDHDVPLPENRLSGQERAGAAETYEDGVWYRRTFRLGRSDGAKAYTLKALGINYVADFWINGRWIGYHEGGFTPFAFDVTPFLREGDNEIRVRVDNPPWGSRHDTIPAVAGTDFFNYTGIVQDLYLEEHSRVHIVRADIVPLDTEGRLRIKVVVENRGPEAETVTVDGELFEAIRDIPGLLASPAASSIKDRPAATDRPLAARLDIGAGQVRALTFEVRVERPKLWSVGDPHLYVAEFRVSGGNGGSAAGAAADVFSTQFGIRTVRTEGTKLLLNGRPLLLAGIARHEE